MRARTRVGCCLKSTVSLMIVIIQVSDFTVKTPPSLTLFARQHTANTAIVSIGLSRICPEARCQAATQAAICHAKAARRRLLSSRSTVPAQGPTRYMHMLSTCCVVSSEVLYALAPAPLPEAMSRR